MNSFVTSGSVLYCSCEGERTILRGKAALFAGGKFFKVACYVTYGRMACGILYKKNADTIYGDIMRNVREKLAETVGKELDNVADNLQKIAEERQKKEECKAILEKLSEKIDKLCNEIEAGGAV